MGLNRCLGYLPPRVSRVIRITWGVTNADFWAQPPEDSNSASWGMGPGNLFVEAPRCVGRIGSPCMNDLLKKQIGRPLDMWRNVCVWGIFTTSGGHDHSNLLDCLGMIQDWIFKKFCFVSFGHKKTHKKYVNWYKKVVTFKKYSLRLFLDYKNNTCLYNVHSTELCKV